MPTAECLRHLITVSALTDTFGGTVRDEESGVRVLLTPNPSPLTILASAHFLFAVLLLPQFPFNIFTQCLLVMLSRLGERQDIDELESLGKK